MTHYRYKIWETGNELAHISEKEDYTSALAAKRALNKELKEYGGDGEGRIEVDYNGSGEWQPFSNY